MAVTRLVPAISSTVVVLLMPIPADADMVIPSLQSNLVCRYDFDHPSLINENYEMDLGHSGTDIQLINGGSAMRTNDGAYPLSGHSLQTRQIDPATAGNDDWKAGVFDESGVATLGAFSSTAGISLMGWVKPTGTNPSLNSNTAFPDDHYNAVGLFGILSGTSEGHNVRALLEIINVSGELRLVALGRRLDTGSSSTFAATEDWHNLLPNDTWTHLTATFDFDSGEMALYRNGEGLDGNKTTPGDPWDLIGTPEPDLTSASNPTGIKIAGSFPQNTVERNPFNGQLDDLMFFDRVLTPQEVQQQFAEFSRHPQPKLSISDGTGEVTLSWPDSASTLVLESNENLAATGWATVEDPYLTNETGVSVTLPATEQQQFFRLRTN